MKLRGEAMQEAAEAYGQRREWVGAFLRVPCFIGLVAGETEMGAGVFVATLC